MRMVLEILWEALKAFLCTLLAISLLIGVIAFVVWPVGMGITLVGLILYSGYANWEEKQARK